MEAIACNICKEPAWNFMCMNCVSRDVKKFLPQRMRGGFTRFHETFYEHFDSPQLILNGAVYCMNCKSTKESPVCPNCYTKEVFHWLEQKNPRLAGKFNKMFSFGKPVNFPDAEEQEESEELGICDECGEYTEELVTVNGEWVCKECADCL